MNALRGLYDGFVPWTQFSLSPHAVLCLVNAIELGGRRTIVECGAGASSIYMAAAGQRTGASIVTLESDERWCETIEHYVRSLSGAEIRIEHVPIVDGSNGMPWYDRSRVDAALGERVADLIVVDGPFAATPALSRARFPAYSYFRRRVAERPMVLIDDVAREGEQNLMMTWAASDPTLQWHTVDGKFAIGQPAGGPAFYLDNARRVAVRAGWRRRSGGFTASAMKALRR